MKHIMLAESNMSDKIDPASFKIISKISRMNNKIDKEIIDIFRMLIVLKLNLLIRSGARFLRDLYKFPSELIMSVSVSLSSS